MKKISKFLKNYGFYLAIGVICIGALAAIFIMPNKGGNVDQNANPYAKNETAEGRDLQNTNENGVSIVEEDDLDTTDEASEKEAALQSEDATQEAEKKTDNMTEEKQAGNETANTSEQKKAETDKEVAEVKTETFESTTASVSEEPFFAEGDTFTWPVDGSVIVPYTDESTSHWYSESLNQTMRTFGICIGGEEGTEVKAVAKGTVTEIVDDSSSYLEKGMPYVGKLMIVDLGNGYTAIYGFQGGTVNEELVGQVVNAGDVLGKIGSPKGAFISQGDNIYLQVTHNDKVINPLNLLATKDGAAKDTGVDVGFAK